MRVSELGNPYDIPYGIKLFSAGMDHVVKKIAEMFTKVKIYLTKNIFLL